MQNLFLVVDEAIQFQPRALCQESSMFQYVCFASPSKSIPSGRIPILLEMIRCHPPLQYRDRSHASGTALKATFIPSFMNHEVAQSSNQDRFRW